MRAKRAQRDVGWIGSEMTSAVVEQLELPEPDGDRVRRLFDRGEVVAEGRPFPPVAYPRGEPDQPSAALYG